MLRNLAIKGITSTTNQDSQAVGLTRAIIFHINQLKQSKQTTTKEKEKKKTKKTYDYRSAPYPQVEPNFLRNE